MRQAAVQDIHLKLYVWKQKSVRIFSAFIWSIHEDFRRNLSKRIHFKAGKLLSLALTVILIFHFWPSKAEINFVLSVEGNLKRSSSFVSMILIPKLHWNHRSHYLCAKIASPKYYVVDDFRIPCRQIGIFYMWKKQKQCKQCYCCSL